MGFLLVGRVTGMDGEGEDGITGVGEGADGYCMGIVGDREEGCGNIGCRKRKW